MLLHMLHSVRTESSGPVKSLKEISTALETLREPLTLFGLSDSFQEAQDELKKLDRALALRDTLTPLDFLPSTVAVIGLGIELNVLYRDQVVSPSREDYRIELKHASLSSELRNDLRELLLKNTGALTEDPILGTSTNNRRLSSFMAKTELEAHRRKRMGESLKITAKTLTDALGCKTEEAEQAQRILMQLQIQPSLQRWLRSMDGHAETDVLVSRMFGVWAQQDSVLSRTQFRSLLESETQESFDKATFGVYALLDAHRDRPLGETTWILQEDVVRACSEIPIKSDTESPSSAGFLLNTLALGFDR